MACIVGHAPRIPFLFDPEDPLTFRGIFYFYIFFFFSFVSLSLQTLCYSP